MGNLLELTLRNVDILLINIPRFERIVKLQVFGYMTAAFSDFLHVLSQMTTLHHLSFHDMHRTPAGVGFPEPSNPPPVFPNLTTIELTQVGCPEMHGVLSRMEVPNLQSLVIRSPHSKLPDELDQDVLRVIEAHPSIRKLEIADCYGEDWKGIFATLPFLTHLHIMTSELKDKDLKHLTISTPEGDPRCPNLTHIILDNVLECTSNSLKEIVLSRLSRSIAIESIVLRGWDPRNVDEEDVATISEHVKYFRLGVFDLDQVMDDQEDATGPGSSDEEDWDSASFTSGDRVILDAGLRYNA